MKKLTFWEMLNAEEDLKKDLKIEKEISQTEKEFYDKTQKEFPKLDEEIWLAHEAFRRAQVVGDEPMLAYLHSKYRATFNKKDSIRSNFRKALDETNQQREALCRPFNAKAVKLVDNELKEIIENYICETPADYRTTPSGRELDSKGYRKNIDSNVSYMKIKTNGDSILKGQELLTVCKGKIANSPSLKNLKESLEALQKEYDLIDFGLKEVEVEEEGFERLDAMSFKEVGYFIHDKILRKVTGPEIFE